MALAFYPKPLAQLWLKEGADACLAEDQAPALTPPAPPLLNQQAAAGEGDAVLLVWLNPARPERLGGVPKHRAPVEALRVAKERPKRTRLVLVEGREGREGGG